MTDTERLWNIIHEKGLRTDFIAKKIGISRYSLYNKIKNKTQFLPSEINALCEILDIKDITVRMEIFFANDVDKTSTCRKEV